ncbi:MAG: hypothetical protein M3Y65_06170 [Pseudomonadota bacterium]|nr:hypothetical protein [Pseudomonadota bacterium]
MQAFTGATYFRNHFVRDHTSHACQQGHAQKMKKHDEPLSSDLSFHRVD